MPVISIHMMRSPVTGMPYRIDVWTESRRRYFADVCPKGSNEPIHTVSSDTQSGALKKARSWVAGNR